MRAFAPIGSGPPLAYLPGLDGSAELLFMQEEQLAERYTVLRIPWRTEGRFEYEDLIADVLEAFDNAGVEHATIVAESFGGSVALLLALAHPERIERLVVLNSFPYFRNRALLRGGRALALSAPALVVNAVRAMIDIPTLAFEGVPAVARNRFLDAARRQPLGAYARRLDLIESFDVRDRIGNISVPTLFVAAEFDRVVPADDARWMAERAPNASLRIIPGAGHATLMTPGVSLAEIIDEWEASLRVAALRARRAG